MSRIKVFILFLLFIPFFVNAETCETNKVYIKSIELKSMSDSVEINHEALIDENNNLHLDFSMSEVGDKVNYDFVVKNNSKEDYELNKSAINSDSSYFDYKVKTDDNKTIVKANSEKVFHLTVEYKNEVPEDSFDNNKFNSENEVVLNLTQNDGTINPKTGFLDIKKIISILFVLSVISYSVFAKKRRVLSVLLLLAIPISIYASCDFDITIKSNIEVVNSKVPYLMGQIDGDEESKFLRTNIEKGSIERIIFNTTIGDHEVNNIDCFDVSKKNDGSVIAWIKDDDRNGLYEVYIASEGIIYASDGKNLFANLVNLDTIEGMEYFDTSNVTSMYGMFNNCISLSEIDLSHLDTSKVTDMMGMFNNCNNIETLDLSLFDTSNLTKMDYMFNNCTNLTTIYASDLFITNKVTSSYHMFDNDISLVGEKGTEYDGDHIDKSYAIIDNGTSNPGYFTKKGVNKVTIYYNSNTAAGEITISKKVAFCYPNDDGVCEINIPSSVSNSVGQYNSSFKGISRDFSSIDSITEVHNNDVLSAFYQSEVEYYYYGDGYKTRTLYRSEVFRNSNEMDSFLSLRDNELVNIENGTTGPHEAPFVGFSFDQDSVVDFESVTQAANSSYNEIYSLYKYTITYQKGYNIWSISKTSDSCNVFYNSDTCTVILPSISATNGYEEKGYAVSSSDGIVFLPNTEYTLTSKSQKLYANAFNYKYQNMQTGTKYFKLTKAFNEVNSNQTIKVINDQSNNIDTGAATIKAGITGVKLDLNGNTVIIYSKMINRGELDIYNSSSTTAKFFYGFDNYGTLTLNGTNDANKIEIIKETNGGLNNNGTLTINDNIEFNERYGSESILSNSGTIYMNGGLITGPKPIDNSYNGTLYINSDNAQIIGTGTAITNTGIVYVQKGTIHGNTTGLSNTSGTYSYSNYDTGESWGPTTKYGTAYISGGTITGGTGVYNAGTLTITGGSITGEGYGVNIQGGTATFGENDDTVSVTSPLIQANDSTGRGVFIKNPAIFNFYDGIIKSSGGSGKSINGTVSDIASSYSIDTEVVDGVEIATLKLSE